ncbi:MAG TPA: hypothetical protein VGW35_24385, partial [Methylomirabilota bacterium]|nr:hypothetical protein [Methylomirabilota bacterium]
SGWGSPDDALVVISGHVGRDAVATTAWRHPGRSESRGVVVPGTGVALVVDARLDTALLRSPLAPLVAFWPMASLSPVAWELWLVGPDGGRHLLTSQLEIRCPRPRLADPRFVCLATDGARTSVWSIDPAPGTLQASAAVTGKVLREALGPDGGLAVWTTIGGTLLNLPARTAVQVALAEEAGSPLDLALERGRLGALVREGASVTATVYEVQ